MRLPGLMKSALCLVGIYPGYPAFAIAVGSPMITAAPLIERDDTGEIFGSEIIGYASVDGSYTASSCPPGSTLKWEDTYGGCVATSATEYAIWSSCEAESILVASKTKYQCGASVCYTALIFEDLDDKSPRSVYGCSAEPHQASLYIATTGTDATSTSSTSNTSTQTFSTKKSTAGVVESTRTQDPASTASTSGTGTGVSGLDSGLGSSESKDRDLKWIAGPIVGGLVGIVIVGLLIWFILRRRRRQIPAVPAARPDPINTGQSDQAAGLQFPTYQWQVQGQESSPRKGQSYHGYMAWTTSSPTDCSSPIPGEKGKEG
ncbi:unnamed protein product [Clonostachys rosea]|uniref:Ig-like domain-containing protein n=1 Tax=Bionectria ochroleuca TaxID=29856 RepID=A0ABY6UCP4_BIOOC|nr:unnamed protein product [Clonostachys rosea]